MSGALSQILIGRRSGAAGVELSEERFVSITYIKWHCIDKRQYQKRISVEKEFSREESSFEEEPLPLVPLARP